jgi:N-acyl-D-amino-acid deacylase
MLRALVLSAALALPALAQYDLVILNARVADGTGAPWFRADVAVAAGKIAAVGRLANAKAARTIDANGRVLAPGFIDTHTHVEGEIERLPRADNFLLDGVTTAVTGNCGGSARDVAAWLARLDGLPLGINIATLYGHNTARREVMGTENRAPTPAELGRMRELVESAMRGGAFGLSTGLEYVPGAYARPEEIIELAKAAARFGGVYASHMRNEGDAILDSIRETARVGREAGLPVQVSHIKIDTPRVWGSAPQAVALLDQLRREGVDIVADLYPYERSATTLGLTLPAWALEGGASALKERLAAPATRTRIAAEMKQMLERRGRADYRYATVASYAKDRSWEGLTIPEITARRGLDPSLDNQIATIFDMLLAGGASMTFHSMSDADIEIFLRWPHTAIASDGGVRIAGEGVPHPRSYGTNARVLARGALPLEEAVRRMTSLPARTFGLFDRGIIRTGMAADLVLFDPARVRDKATYLNPHQFSEGFDFVLVNGVVMVDNGALTAAEGGRALRRPAPPAAARYDLLIRNARVADGTGAPWFRADVAVNGARIAAIGRLADAQAARTIDAAGRILAPGFIDVHTHAERGIVRLPRADNFLRDGVTTVLTGNCGGSESDIALWLAQLDALPLGVNVATLYGHNTARREVMGAENRRAAPEELARMRALVERAMSAGAFGLSTGLEYVPGNYAPAEEIAELARVAVRHGGVYATHMRDEGDKVLEAIAESLRTGREAGIAVRISHLKQDTRSHWGSSARMLALLEEARREGVDVSADQYPYDAFSTGLTFLMPPWALAAGAAPPRDRLASEMLATLRLKGHPDFSYVRLASFPARPEWEGKTITEVNALLGRAPGAAQEVETVIDLVNMGGGSGVFRSMSEEDIARIMAHRLVAIASDGGVALPGEGVPHPRSYGTNARVLARGALPVEEAVRKMTSLPAAAFGFPDRGIVRPGFAADLVLFDPARVRDRATYENPHQFSEGFDFVLVNGAVMVDGGALTSAKGGRALRRP